ncbi:MAG: Osmosensitive K+ channel histidine kinase KdpD [uncultured Thermomicrobiales bacterium]|uniref:histidine kinase n=1 Tax=uncultured Thermomicrobiales bacterium TaxID=1645740 RepID=A0A6J4U1V9_9BACT|nr:MAG: Osmosensitive K+ channel histidine kinase KdpD [uncultured Thermomicrobiales bacterium]
MTRLGSAVRACCGAPFNLLRRRIGAQLVAAHVLVVLLTIVVIQAAGILSLLGWLPDVILGGENAVTDYSLGEKARSLSYRLQVDVVANRLRSGPTAVERAALTGLMQRVTATDPNQPDALNRVDKALLTDHQGTIIAASDDDWAVPGRRIESVDFAPVAMVTRRAIARGGKRDDLGESYAIDVEDRVTVAAHAIQTDDGAVAGVVLLQSVPYRLTAATTTREVVAELLEENLRILLLSAAGAILVAVPVGIWRARAVAVRLSRLAAAADAMASGDRSRRVDDRGDDEIGRLSERFNGMAARLAAADQTRRDFVANVSHELRTPVAVIQGHAEHLLARHRPARSPVAVGAGGAGGGLGVDAAPDRDLDPHPARDAESDAAVGVILRETVTLGRLIDDLFTLARLEETALPLEIVPVGVPEVVAEAVAGVRTPAWTQRRVSVTSLVPDHLPRASADPTRLRQILNNLLYNALRHTPEGGVIVVDAAPTPDGAAIAVSVTDTGAGIPADDLPHVFARFYRGSRGDRRAEGAGLGLHIVQQLVEAQGGTIAAESAPGQGATFRFTLPRAG